MLPTTAAQWHAALNDFPSVALLLVFAFYVMGELTKRDSLRAAGFWTLVAGAVGSLLALISGLVAEESIEHGETVHEVMERHETLGITLTVLLVVLALWRIWRHARSGTQERRVFVLVTGLGAAFALWTAHVGGTIVFEHGGGLPTQALEEALRERGGTEIEGEPGEELGELEGGTNQSGGGNDTSHTDPAGAPPHQH